MAKQYGNTWWGLKWLDAFGNIDDSNRLPRGKTYANTGRVKDIAIDGGLIKASVQGSQSRPYKEKIAVKYFTENEKEIIISTITENPFLLSSLLNRELPIELYEELKKQNISLFPTSWRDMDATCSCPDYAMPCKHLAAVIYMIANEIDKNPFISFKLKGLDILEEIQKSGFTAQGEIKSTIENIDNLLVKTVSDKSFHTDIGLINKIDFSIIPEAGHILFTLLEKNPLFYPQKDFKEILEKYYRMCAADTIKSLKTNQDIDDPILTEQIESIKVWMDTELDYQRTTLSFQERELPLSKIRNSTISVLIQELKKIPVNRLLNFSPSIIAVYFHYQFALYLVQKNAFIPQIIQIDKNQFKILYLPALLIVEVQQIFDTLCGITPSGIICVEDKKENSFFEKSDQSKFLVHLFISYFIEESSFYALEDDINNLFFRNDILDSSNFGQQETAFSIQKWLQKFYLRHKKFSPVFKIEEDEDTKSSFILSMWIENKTDELEKLISLKDLFKKKEYQQIRLEALQDISSLAEYLPQIKEMVSSKGMKDILVNAEEFVSIFLNTLPALRLLGLNVLLPKSLQRLARPKTSARVQTKGSVGSSAGYVGLDNMLVFDWQISIGDQFITQQEFLKLVKDLRGIVKVNNQYVLLDEKEIQSIMKKLKNPPEFSASEMLKIALSQDYEGAKIQLDKKAKTLIDSFIKIEKVSLPKGLKAKLRPYQQRGYEWMYKNSKIKFGSLLADDMGLGKTLQVITLLLKFKEEGRLNESKKALIVVPTTLLTNWQKEVDRFAPSLTTYIYHGTNRKLELKADIILTTYGVIRSDIKDIQKHKWAVLAIDEAQNIKNTDTEQTKAVKKLKSEVVIAMSGTPVENRLSEYWSIFDFTNKGYLGSLNHFKEGFIKPIELERNQELLDNFKKITSPFILRRVKTDKNIISDLPDKVETDDICMLSPEQSALYKNYLDMILDEMKNKEGIARRGLVFQMMIALKQICNHPSNFLKKNTISPEISGKTQMLLSLLDNILEVNEKVLIFTQYKEMGDLLVKLIKETYQFEPLWLHGGCSRKQRDAMVDAFQNKNNPKVMILSLKAGGTGLNLTEANHVIHYDLWWNPAVESQATDRAFRIGQKKNVQVHRFISKGTFEEKINEMIQKKKDLANLTVASGETWIGDMSNEELKDIFKLE